MGKVYRETGAFEVVSADGRRIRITEYSLQIDGTARAKQILTAAGGWKVRVLGEGLYQVEGFGLGRRADPPGS